MKAVTRMDFKPYRPFLFETGDIYSAGCPEKEQIAFLVPGRRQGNSFFSKARGSAFLVGTTKEAPFL